VGAPAGIFPNWKARLIVVFSVALSAGGHYTERTADLNQCYNHERNLMNADTENRIEDTTGKLLEDVKQVVRDGEELLRAGAGEMSEKGKAARARLAAALESAKETGRKLQARTIEGAKATDRAIREHPYQSIGIAFGIGLLIGVLVNRK
jgi:ElaB/YqjD/DUF883 family membrane-anchored ribosome-binding protein